MGYLPDGSAALQAKSRTMQPTNDEHRAGTSRGCAGPTDRETAEPRDTPRLARFADAAIAHRSR
jgi:hypothetical protein